MTIGDPSGMDATRFSNADFSRSINALFDSRAHAEAARQDLIAAGVHADHITIVGDGSVPTASPAAYPESGGFWEILKDLFMPEEDTDQFAEAVSRGGVTVAVRSDTANHDRIVDILDRDGAVNLDERTETWRNDGWTGYTGRDPLIEARTPALAIAADDQDMSYAPASAGTAGFGASVADHFPVGLDAAPPIESPGALPSSMLEGTPEEPNASPGERVAGTRNTSLGRARVRSYRWGDETSPPDPGP